MSSKLLAGFGLILLLSWSEAALGAKTADLDGSIGLIEIPSAFTLPAQSYQLGGSVQFGSAWQAGQNRELTEGLFKYCANLTLHPNLEVGIVGEGSREGVFVNLKYSLVNESNARPLALALGVSDLFSRERTGVYLCASKVFLPEFTAHLGFATDFPRDQALVSGFIGGEFDLIRSLTIVSDFRFGQNDLHRLNAGLVWQIIPQLNLSANGLNLVGEKKGCSVGLNLTGDFF